MNRFLADCRKDLNMKIREMAERLNIDESYVSKLESGAAPMTYAVAAAYSRVTRKARGTFESMIPPKKSNRNGKKSA